jgi:3-isopropylmalate/(R)-2-methylmalate dehydratase small subunit
VIARSFARIYFRNAINQALPIAVCDALDTVLPGQVVTVDFSAGTVETPGGKHEFPPLPPEVMEILDCGGLIPFVRKQMGLG